jgi:histidine triad (HIT) family protein
MTCAFCGLVDGGAAAVVLEDADFVAFLDHRPLFPGHVLLVPRRHYETLADLPAPLVGPLFQVAQKLARAMETGLGAEGSFVAVNNRVSQSVPHLHVHIVPRNRGDGLKGFFWPRRKYADAAEMEAIRDRLREAVSGG